MRKSLTVAMIKRKVNFYAFFNFICIYKKKMKKCMPLIKAN